MHPGYWGGLPDLGITEWAQRTLWPNAPLSKDQGSDISSALGLTKPQAGNPPPPPPPPNNPPPTSPVTQPTGQVKSAPAPATPAANPVDTAAKAQEDAAKAAAEAKRQAAMRKYQAQVGIAGQAKEQAKGSYDWIVDTIGSNKQDVLEKIATEQATGEAGYASQETKTKTDYDNAKQQILSMYRDLGREQEKILRGAGLGQSSRSIESQMKLNNLLAKDLGGVSTNEADSLAMIGNAVSALKDRSSQAKVSVEREAQGKLDKAALDYKGQIDSIDANLNLSANEREDAYAQADAQLATDIANVKSWAAGLKLQQEQTTAKLKDLLDGFIGDMTDSNALLNADIGTKKQATNAVLNQIGLTPMDVETSITTPSVGVKQKLAAKTYGSKDELDAALAAGQITPLQYSAQLESLQKGGTAGGASSMLAGGITPTTGMMNGNAMSAGATTPQDELMRAVFA